MPDIHDVLTRIPGLGKAEILTRLGQGPASDSWLVKSQGRRLVVRADRPGAKALGLDRRAELVVLNQVSKAGIGPQLFWADPAAGVLVTAFITGGSWDPERIHDPASLDRLASLLRRLHALPAKGRHFQPAQAALVYARRIGTEFAFELASRAGRLASELSPGGQRALCHNDLLYHNIMGSGVDCDPLRLIDWEYAAVGDPFFDLATVIRHHELGEPLVRGFLESYSGAPDDRTRERLDRFACLYDLLTALWYLAVCQQPGHDPFFEFERDRVLARIQRSAVPG